MLLVGVLSTVDGTRVASFLMEISEADIVSITMGAVAILISILIYRKQEVTNQEVKNIVTQLKVHNEDQKRIQDSIMLPNLEKILEYVEKARRKLDLLLIVSRKSKQKTANLRQEIGVQFPSEVDPKNIFDEATNIRFYVSPRLFNEIYKLGDKLNTLMQLAKVAKADDLPGELFMLAPVPKEFFEKMARSTNTRNARLIIPTVNEAMEIANGLIVTLEAEIARIKKSLEEKFDQKAGADGPQA